MSIRTIVPLALLALALFIGSCPREITGGLAIKGHKKYMVDLNSIILDVQDEIDNKGDVSEPTKAKLDKFLARNEAEFKDKGSFIYAKEIQKWLDTPAENEAKEFENNQNVRQYINYTIEAMKTEGDGG